MSSIGADFHKAYSRMTVLDGRGQMVKAGKVANNCGRGPALSAAARVLGQSTSRGGSDPRLGALETYEDAAWLEG